MSNINWEATFSSWAKSPGITEQEKCDNSERAVRQAVISCESFNERNVRVFPQGSYRNRTNISSESDVDIGVVCTDSFFYDLPEGFSADVFDITTPAPYSFSEYKGDLHQALNDHFGEGAVDPGNKAFDIHENSYRIDADVIPLFEYRSYRRDGTYLTGVAFLTDDGIRIVNWPEQNYSNGVTKNNDTKGSFKAVTRIIKNLRVKMEEDGITAAKPIASYLIECLVWNVPNEGLMHDTYKEDVRYALAHLYNNTREFDKCKEWGEVNEIKYLFRSWQPWTLAQTHAFIDAAWNYLGFE